MRERKRRRYLLVEAFDPRANVAAVFARADATNFWFAPFDGLRALALLWVQGVRVDAVFTYTDDDATPNDRREGITTLEETERTARRVLGGSHPLVAEIQKSLRDVQAAVRDVQAALRARETQPPRTFAPGWLDGPS